MVIITTTFLPNKRLKDIPITLNSKEKTAMNKNYQTAIVTGASHGIGPFIVRALAKEGMNLVLAARSESELEQVATAADIRATGVHVLTVPTDVTDREARSSLVNTAERTFGSVDVLVNNAGGDLQREFHHYTAEEVAQTVLKSIRRDKAEIVIMPGPGRLLRALMDLFPGMGSMMGQMGAPVMKQVVEFRERQRAQMDANAHQPAEQR